MTAYTLGLDIGSKSIGWALLDEKENKIINLGVRVFPEGVDRDTKGLEKSKNATRREARTARRNHQRRNLRKEQLLRTLQAEKLLPLGNSGLKSLFHTNPYKLRKKALDEKLDPYEFGRILYHLSQRRGFKSNRKTGKTKEDGFIIKGANALQKEMDDKNARTIGEYFAGLNPDEKRIRGQYTFRSMYEKEFDLLWTKQTEFYPDILTEDLQKKVRDEIIFYQRPMKWNPETIGNCELESGEKRCPRGDWYARRFRLLQDVNNLIIQNSDGSERNLNDEQMKGKREKLLSELSKKKDITFDKIRKLLGLIKTQKFNAEYKIGRSGKHVKSLKGDTFTAGMRSKNVFGVKRWDAMDEHEKMNLNKWLIELEDDQLREKLRAKYGFTDNQIEAALKISVPQGYMSFSKKAIVSLLEFMEQGALTSEAIAQAYPNRKATSEENKGLDRLRPPESLRNPIVNKAMFELRKVVNAIVREYGKPAKIKIEMARDVQGSKRQREELHWKIFENEKRNEEARKRLREDIGIRNPRRDDVIKYNLWVECGKRCPYTGRQISQAALFGPNPEFQIEHILPYDRSLDDSYMNKTLCAVRENIHIKRDQTPYETYGHHPERYEQIKQNIKHLPWPKRRKFLQKEIDLDQSITRELNDTRYICKEVVRYLKKLGVYVRGTKGKITGELRHQWGLDGVFDELETKRNDDHRRHAVDAVIVGVTENEHLRKLARSKYSVTGARFEPPWPDFREGIREKVKQINVSHRMQRKVSGKLHEETNYGMTGKKDEKGQEYFVYRKKIEDLTVPMIEKIVDPVVRDIVKQRLTKKGIDLSKRGKIPKEVWKEPLYMKTTISDNKITIKKIRVQEVFNNMIVMNDIQGRPYRAVAPGSNHHVEIWEYTEGPKKGKRDAEVVSMFEVVNRSRRGEEVVNREHGVAMRFVCSLAINDMVMLSNNYGEMDLFRVQKMNVNKQVYFRHHTASQIDDDTTVIRKQANLFDGYKVTVDPLGRVWPAND